MRFCKTYSFISSGLWFLSKSMALQDSDTRTSHLQAFAKKNHVNFPRQHEGEMTHYRNSFNIQCIASLRIIPNACGTAEGEVVAGRYPNIPTFH